MTITTCVNCGESFQRHPILFFEGAEHPTEEEKKTKGMGYSEEGVAEMQISGLCEACFDVIKVEWDEEDLDSPEEADIYHAF